MKFEIFLDFTILWKKRIFLKSLSQEDNVYLTCLLFYICKTPRDRERERERGESKGGAKTNQFLFRFLFRTWIVCIRSKFLSFSDRNFQFEEILKVMGISFTISKTGRRFYPKPQPPAAASFPVDDKESKDSAIAASKKRIDAFSFSTRKLMVIFFICNMQMHITILGFILFDMIREIS